MDVEAVPSRGGKKKKGSRVEDAPGGLEGQSVGHAPTHAGSSFGTAMSNVGPADLHSTAAKQGVRPAEVPFGAGEQGVGPADVPSGAGEQGVGPPDITVARMWAYNQEISIVRNNYGLRCRNDVVGFGSLIGDHARKWFLGFFGYIGTSDSIPAELLAIYHGSFFSWKKRYKKIHCKSDCIEVVELLHWKPTFHKYRAIIASIQKLTSLD
ncbi:hypothetical protein VNO77_26786 [Canavalia gladiata]|uniref:RNase H type-1 domain-containing protein n=1 Tax=Canavalia gladiata TaxID=3824 RepID=A0AAN9KXN8_CANGL